MFRTPIERRLSEEDSELLFETYSKLIGDYNAARLDVERIKRIKEQNNVRIKISMIRENLRGRNRSTWPTFSW